MRISPLSSTRDDNLSLALHTAIDNKNKPQSSLGVLELIAQRVGLIQQIRVPCIDRAAFVADHGIVAENVSAYPQSVTWQMGGNLLAEGAAINVFARQNACVHIVDAGVNHDFSVCVGLICCSAAIMHKMTGIPVAQCAGTGLTAQGVRYKQVVIEQAVVLHAEMLLPLDVLRTFGGFEIAMMTGAMLEVAERRMVLLIDVRPTDLVFIANGCGIAIDGDQHLSDWGIA